jgi:hypothetical protein
VKGNSVNVPSGGKSSGIGSAIIGAIAGGIFQKRNDAHVERMNEINQQGNTAAIQAQAEGARALSNTNTDNFLRIQERTGSGRAAAVQLTNEGTLTFVSQPGGGNPSDNDVSGQPSAAQVNPTRVESQFAEVAPAAPSALDGAAPTGGAAAKPPKAPRASRTPKADKPKATKSRTTKKAAANPNNVVTGSLSDDIAAAQERDTAKKTAAKKSAPASPAAPAAPAAKKAAAPAAKKTTAKAPAKGKKA